MKGPILVTVGSQMPFDRLVHAVDRWAAARGRSDVLAQVGATDAPPRHVEWVRSLPREEYARRVAEASLVVAHAGTGTLFAALEHGTPLLVLPRRADLGETRNDHQLATAERFAERGWVAAAADASELVARLDEPASIPAPAPLAPRASGPLVERLRGFLQEHLG